MGRKQSVEEQIEMADLDQVQLFPARKTFVPQFGTILRPLVQRIILMLSELDPMIPIMLTLLIMRDGSSFDRQVIVIGSLLALILIEEIV